jgi:hypothetical protein
VAVQVNTMWMNWIVHVAGVMEMVEKMVLMDDDIVVMQVKLVAVL